MTTQIPLIQTIQMGIELGGNSILRDLDFAIDEGEIVTIVGRSGSGKSTFLDLIMGLMKPTSGSVKHRSNDLKMSYLFQRPALLPWRTVESNVTIPLEVEGVERRSRRERASEALKKVGLHYARALYPYQLSGGMSQRVAIARALVQQPDLLLMDEPFSNLDPLLRENMNINLLRLWQRTKNTILFVTHSIDEAVILSDRILVLESGRFVYDLAIDIPRPRDEHTFHTRLFAESVRRVREHLPFQPNLPQQLNADEVP